MRCLAALFLFLAVFLTVPAAQAERRHDCGFCHGLHGADLVPQPSQVENLCLNCHGPSGNSLLKADVHKNKPAKGNGSPRFIFNFTCTDCHNPHEGESFLNWKGGQNIKMVGRADHAGGSGVTELLVPGLGLRNVVFSSTTGPDSFADGVLEINGTYDGACETCHSSPLLNHHPNELCTDAACGDHDHNVGERCTQCHRHNNFFWK